MIEWVKMLVQQKASEWGNCRHNWVDTWVKTKGMRVEQKAAKMVALRDVLWVD